MNDILTSKPTPSPSHSAAPPSPLTMAHLPPKGRGRTTAAVRGRQRKRIASGSQKKVGFSTNNGPIKRSQSDSKLYREQETREDGLSNDEVFGGSASSLHGTYVMASPGYAADWQKGYKGPGKC